MSQAGERTEEATPRRCREARRDGQAAKSADLTAAVCLTAAGAWLAASTTGIAGGTLEFARRAWGGAMDVTLTEALSVAAGATLPVLLICASVGALATLLQVGPILSPKVITPKLDRLSPISGVKKLFSFQRLMVIARTALALSLSLAVCIFMTREIARAVIELPASHSPPAFAVLLASHLPLVVAASGLALLAPGALDLLLTRHRLARDLRMTRRQVKDEHKQDEGDPMFRNERRRAQKELAATPVRPLDEAKVLVVNPTHIAVALHHGGDMPVPEVGVRGQGDEATRLRGKARALGLPIVRDVTLARALMELDPGRQVPEALFSAVAAVLAAVYRAKLAHAGRVKD